MAEPRFGLSDPTLASICAVLAGHPGILRAWLYGSRAKGTFHPGSDIDLSLEGDALTHADLLTVANALDDLELPYKIDLSLLHQIDNPDLLDHIHRVGVVLYGDDPARPRQAA